MITDARVAHPTVSVRRLCELHDVSRSWYIHQLGREQVDRDQPLAEDLEAVVLKWSGYGYRRVSKELARRGRPANHKRVLRVMRERRLLCRPKRRYHTDSGQSVIFFEAHQKSNSFLEPVFPSFSRLTAMPVS